MDAFHVPAMVCTTNGQIYPGNKVVFVDAKKGVVRLCPDGVKPHGIVDSFYPLDEDESRIDWETPFWVILYPGLTSNLTHKFDITLTDVDPDNELDDGWNCQGCDTTKP